MAWAIAAGSACGRAVHRLARIRYRLLLINLLVVMVPLVGIGFAGLHERQLLAALERDMIHQAELVRALITAGDRPLEALQPLLRTAARDTRTRIRVLDPNARVRADSHRGGPPEGAERAVPYLGGGASPTHVAEPPREIALADRREIRAALAGRYGSATRLWDNQDRVYLFSALPVVDERGEVTAVVYVTKSTRDVKLQLFVLRTWLVRISIATLIATALITLLLSTTIARPLGRLTRRAQRIAGGRAVEERERETRRADEIGELARAVEAMTDELERRARDARTLAADLSHELKTPLTGIRGAAELMLDGAGDDRETRDRFLAMIVEDTARLDRLVSRLLELARVDDDRAAALPVDVARLARACAARTWATPVVVAGAAEAFVLGREPALASAIENLVANAVQFADAGTTVHVTVARDHHATRVTVANRGPALSSAARTKVWDRFYSTRTARGGSGLGLAIVRSVAHAHGGAVGVHCDGGVTSFWFELPHVAGADRPVQKIL
ncbi:MAG TPA: ATP-binding protein [Kofleriaceae bacterium]|nr:ATP-binding protein [Kofleriaceae bacterium]